jgi:predicted negative regulator of RcsB-dependent stress response
VRTTNSKKPKRSPQRRMSSRELREKMSHDPLVDSVNWLRNTWSQQGGKITWSLVAFVLVFFAVYFYRDYRRSQVDQATMLLDVAHDDFGKSVGAQGEEKKKLEETALGALDSLIAGFSGTRQAVHGLLLKGDILYKQGLYEQALEVYRSAALNAEKPEMIVVSRMGIAQCRTDLEGADAGASELEQILAEFPDTNFADQIHFQLARLYEAAGDTEQAVHHYTQIHEDSAYLDEQTKRKIEFLKAPVVRFLEPSA